MKYHARVQAPRKEDVSVPRQITTFGGFIRHIIKLVVGLVVLISVLLALGYFLTPVIFGKSMFALFTSLPLPLPPPPTSPSGIGSFMMQVMTTEPTKSL